MYLKFDLRGWRSLRELLFGYTRDEVAEFELVRDSYRAGHDAARRNRRTTVPGAAIGGLLDGMHGSVSMVGADSVRQAIARPDTNHYASSDDLTAARRAMKARRDARLGRTA